MGGSGLSLHRGDVGGLDFGGGVPYHPDRSFDTIACGGTNPLSVLAALEKGGHAALVSGPLAEDLLGWGDGRAVPEGVSANRALVLDGSGRLVVPRLRPWLGSCGAGELRVVVNAPIGPYLCRPLQMGADVVIEDLSALLDPALLPAASCGACAAVVTRNERSWGEFWERVGVCGPLMELTASEEELLCVGLRCLAGVSQRRSDAALAVAHYLAAHPMVAWVSYPGLTDDGANADARATLEHGFGPLVAFGLPAESPGDAQKDRMARGSAVRSCLRRGALSGSWVFSAGLESALDVVAALDRLIAEGLALGSGAR